MPKTHINKPLNAYLVHYSDFSRISGYGYKIQILCKSLVEQDISGQLWIYNNQDTNYEYMPDVIYPSIRKAAEYANTQYWQMGIHYGKTKNQIWGVLEKYGTPNVNSCIGT